MTSLVLTYFDFSAGRAEPARLAFRIGNIPFEDHRFAAKDLGEIRKTTPLGQVPTLKVDGVTITQSDAITRYAGKLAGLYPTDIYQALLCDEALGVVEDAYVRMDPTYGLQGEAQKAARQTLVQGTLSTVLRWMQARLQALGTGYFADGRLTVADLKVFVFVRGLCSGRLDHVPTDLVATLAPLLMEHQQRIGAVPAVAQHFAPKA